MSYRRYLKDKILSSLRVSPVVLLTGGRQTGKTTLVKEIAKEHNFDYLTFDNLNFLTSAREDPMGSVASFQKPLIIDEVQRVPEIALPIKEKVDGNRKPGMYVLTGSSNPLVAPKLNDSLAGRMFILQLYPLAYAEILGTKPNFLEMLFQPSWNPGKYARWGKEDMIYRLVLGGYPTVQDLSLEHREEWFSSHIRTLLERDIYDLAQIRKKEDLFKVLKLLAYRSGSLMNISEISRTAGIPQTTLSFYLTLLESLYLIARQPAWHKNHTKKLTKSPKMYLVDSGILTFLIGADEKRLQKEPSLLGSIVETFVAIEIEKLMGWSSFTLDSYHYRTASATKVDIVLENRSGEVVGIEVKSSETLRKEDAKGLLDLQMETKGAFIRGVILYPGQEVVSLGNNIYGLPMSSLFS